MNYMLGKVVEVCSDHILAELDSGAGYKLFTLIEDEYIVNKQYKLFIYEDIKLENNAISINRFAFLDPNVMGIFRFLMTLRGVGPKVAKSIIVSFGGSKKLIDILNAGDRDKIVQTNRKYSDELIKAMNKSKNQLFIENAARNIFHKSIRTEVLWILSQMNSDKGECMNVIDSVNRKLINGGQEKGIDGLKLEDAIRECLALMFNR